MQTTNRAINNKRVLKLRKELSGVSSGFNQSRSASQGRAVLAANGQSTSQALNQLVSETHKTKTNLNQNGTHSEVDLHRNTATGLAGGLSTGLQNLKTSKAYDAYNSKQSLPGQGSYDAQSQLSSQGKNTRNAMNHIISQQQQ